MRRDLAAVGAIWLVLTVIGELLAQADVYPVAGSDKAADIEAAFRFLLAMAVPVFTFVLSALIYSVIRFRRTGTPTGDGPALRGRGRVPLLWFWITSGLALLIMVYPGLTELPKFVHAESSPDLVVEVDAFQWAWKVRYPEADVETVKELVLPVDRSVRFDITSLDVIHAFWVPAFAMRIDAVPGLTTSISLRPTTTGDYADDELYRLQCSQLCGLSHSRMVLPVRVVTEAEFAAWLAQQPRAGGGGGSTPAPGGTEISISAKNIRFSTDRLEAKAGAPTTITFINDDVGVIHNIAVYGQNGELVDDARTAFETGPRTQVLVLPALPAGSYIFKCDAHPTEMVGVLDVE